MAEVYISHSGSTKKYTQLLFEQLAKAGISATFRSGAPRGPYSNSGPIAADECDIFVVFLDKSSLQTGAIKQEIEAAYLSNKDIIAVRLYKHLALSPTLERHLAGCLWFDGEGQPDNEVASLLTKIICERCDNDPSCKSDGEKKEDLDKIDMPAAYSGSLNYIFISYAHKNRDTVLPIIAALNQYFYIWYDEGIYPGAEWDDMIADKLEKCGYVIAFLSREYMESENCKDELNFARDLGKRRLLVYLDDVKLSGGLAMRFNRSQSIHISDFTALNMLVDKIKTADGLNKFFIM